MQIKARRTYASTQSNGKDSGHGQGKEGKCQGDNFPIIFRFIPPTVGCGASGNLLFLNMPRETTGLIAFNTYVTGLEAS